jgi:hypothetical protein
MDKLFTIAGTSTVNGVNTYRVANGKAKVREGVLRRAGHTDISLRDLPNEMSKPNAIAWLNAQGVTAVLPVKNAVVGRPTKSATLKAERDAAKAAAAAQEAAPVAQEDADFLAQQAAAAEAAAGEVIAQAEQEAVAEAAPELTFAQRMAAARAAKRAAALLPTLPSTVEG